MDPKRKEQICNNSMVNIVLFLNQNIDKLFVAREIDNLRYCSEKYQLKSLREKFLDNIGHKNVEKMRNWNLDKESEKIVKEEVNMFASDFKKECWRNFKTRDKLCFFDFVFCKRFFLLR